MCRRTLPARARRRRRRAEEAAALRAAVAATAARAAAAEKAEAEKSATLAELHEKARWSPRRTPRRARRRRRRRRRADLPPTAAVVAAADAGLDLKSLSLRIARDLDASVDRVARAARGRTLCGARTSQGPRGSAVAPYPSSPRRWRPGFAADPNGNGGARDNARADGAVRGAAARVAAPGGAAGAGSSAARRVREPPAYAFSEGDDAFGSGGAGGVRSVLRVGNQKIAAARADVGRGAEPRRRRRRPRRPPAAASVRATARTAAAVRLRRASARFDREHAAGVRVRPGGAGVRGIAGAAEGGVRPAGVERLYSRGET